LRQNWASTTVRTCLLLISLAGVCLAQLVTVQGAVHDTSGAVIPHAQAALRSGSFQAVTQSDERGQFVFTGVAGLKGTLEVKANGFATATESWVALPAKAVSVEIVLHAASREEQVIVSASRTELRLSEVPGSVVRLDQDELVATSALALDDALRQVPGFTLFRRSSSRTANPTSLGVSLRGLGASGPSRAAVLVDGIPLTDPFGNWVYWGRVPRSALTSVEILRGGASSLYGTSALGGVVQFITREPGSPAFTLETSYGSEKTPDVSFWGGTKYRAWDFEGGADLFRSDGYVVVPVNQRGAVDTAANAEHGTLDFGIGHQLGNNGRVFLRGNLFDEARHNGTPLQVNDTHVAEGSAGLDKQLSQNDSLSARVYADVQAYNQSFSSIAANRNSESLVDLQHVPAQATGGNVQWTHVLSKGHTLIAGGDLQEVIGASDEQIFVSGTHIADSVAGGRQRTLGIFGEDVFRPHQKWTFILGTRVDRWQNLNGVSIRTPVSSATAATASFFPDRNETAFSPRVSVMRSVTSNLSVTASAYRAFRAPTLNELYRSFRLGNVLTQSNSALRAERLTGGEAGLNVLALNRKLELRSTFFWSDIVNPVSNVTLSSTPALITRQRQNLGRTRSRGLELEGVGHISSSIEISAGYNFIDATVVHFPANTSLEGLEIPQVPQNQFTWSARYWKPSFLLLNAQGRFVGAQFDDDQNLLPLGRFYTMDLLIARPLGHGMEIFGAGENLLNQRYAVARTPIVNLGPPLLLRIGLRYNYPAGK
jgi:outer membrane receptor protein involved in Fe transport